MATGDLHGNLERLRVQLHSVQYPQAFDVQGLKEGIPACILPLVHYALLGYSRHLARFLSANGYELWAKSDLRFMESTLKFLRQEFNYRSALTMAQMFARGYAERKLLFVCDVIQMCKRKHNELLKLVHEKTHTYKVNYDPANLATARRPCEGACPTSLPSMKTKPWERTLRMPQEKAHLDANFVPEASDSSYSAAVQATTLERKPTFQQRKISLETNMDNNEILAALTAAGPEQINVSSMPSPKTVKPNTDDLSQVTHENLQVQPSPSPEILSSMHDDHCLQQPQPTPSSGPLNASYDIEQQHLLQALSPSFEAISASHGDDHHSIGAQHPPSSGPSSASYDSDRHYLLQAPPPSSSSTPLSASQDNIHQEQNMVQDYHEELCQKIMEMADRLEARFCVLEDGITKARETLQEKLVSLEGRVSLLETPVPHQEIELDSARRKLQHHQGPLNQQAMQPAHHVASGWQDDAVNFSRWQLPVERDREHCNPREPFPENLQNCECEQLLWIPNHAYFNILNCRHACGPTMPMPVLGQHSQTIRDISNTHQYMENNHLKLQSELNENLCKVPDKVRTQYLEKKPLSTQDMVADIQSRFNRAMELLYQDGQV